MKRCEHPFLFSGVTCAAARLTGRLAGCVRLFYLLLFVAACGECVPGNQKESYGRDNWEYEQLVSTGLDPANESGLLSALPYPPLSFSRRSIETSCARAGTTLIIAHQCIGCIKGSILQACLFQSTKGRLVECKTIAACSQSCLSPSLSSHLFFPGKAIKIPDMIEHEPLLPPW